MKILHCEYEIELINGGVGCYGVNVNKNGVTATYLTSVFDDGDSCSRRYCGAGYDFVSLAGEQVWCENRRRELTGGQLDNTRLALQVISKKDIRGKVFCGEHGIFTNGYVY